MPRWEAASISMTSRDSAAAMRTQLSQTPHGWWWAPCSGAAGSGPLQLRALARMRAMLVLPVPRGPANTYPWATVFSVMALVSVRATWSWPTTSANVCGR